MVDATKEISQGNANMKILFIYMCVLVLYNIISHINERESAGLIKLIFEDTLG